MPIFQRYCYVAEWRAGTSRNSFPHEAPLGMDLFKAIAQLHRNDTLQPFQIGDKTISLSRIKVSHDGFISLLIRMVDPAILDNDYLNRNNGEQRRAERYSEEDPVVSAHVVINCDSRYDPSRQYPTAIGNVDFLSRSLIQRFFGSIFSRNFAEKRIERASGKEKVYQPKLELQSPHAHTIAGSLQAGGVLKEIKWVEDREIGGAFGDDAYRAHERHSISVSFENSPTGDDAAGIITRAWRNFGQDRPKKVSILIEEQNDRVKTVPVDSQ